MRVSDTLALWPHYYLIHKSGLFDVDYYMDTSGPMRRRLLPPIAQFLMEGSTTERSPNPYFDTKWYLAQNKDVAQAGTNPLVHYLKRGAGEGRDPSPSSIPSGTF